MFDGRFRHGVDRSTRPVGRALVRLGVTADILTVFGLAMSVLSAVVVGSGHLVWGIVMLFAVGLPDLFDGPVAKASGAASARGAFFDSVADRISDAFLYGGVAWYLSARHHGQMVLLPMAILAVTSLISYERAKAELLGIDAKGGLMERAERFILLGVCYLAGAVDAAAFVPTLWLFLGLLSVTAVGRFLGVWRAAEGPAVPLRPRRAAHRSRRLGEGRPATGRIDARLATWREARLRRDGLGARPMVPLAERRPAEALARWRSRRADAVAARRRRSDVLARERLERRGTRPGAGRGSRLDPDR